MNVNLVLSDVRSNFLITDVSVMCLQSYDHCQLYRPKYRTIYGLAAR